MTSREIRQIRRDTGYILQSNEVSTRSLRIAQRNARKRKANVSENDKDKANEANIPSKVKLKRNVVSRQSLESIGKTMRTSTSNLTQSSKSPSKDDTVLDEELKTQGKIPHIRTLHDSNDIVNDFANTNENETKTHNSNSSNAMNELNNIDLDTISDDMSNTDTDKRNEESSSQQNNINLDKISDDMSNADTDKRRSSPRIAKLNAVECMKQLLLPPMPAELS